MKKGRNAAEIRGSDREFDTAELRGQEMTGASIFVILVINKPY
jgi:hypothetical protein